MPTASHALCADLDLIQHIHCMLLLHAARIDMRSYDSSLLVCQVTKHMTLMWSTHKDFSPSPYTFLANQLDTLGDLT